MYFVEEEEKILKRTCYGLEFKTLYHNLSKAFCQGEAKSVDITTMSSIETVFVLAARGELDATKPTISSLPNHSTADNY